MYSKSIKKKKTLLSANIMAHIENSFTFYKITFRLPLKDV